MHAGIHKEMAFKVLSDYPNKDLFTFLLEGTAKPEWKENEATKIKWLKEWMDMPDDKKHSSKQKNDHSYKLVKDVKGFHVKFINKTLDQATVVARLKYAFRDAKEWKIEEEERACAIEIAKSIHWVIDFSTPPHTVADWPDKEHSAIETHFDKMWQKYYDVGMIKFKGNPPIQDVYLWAKKFAEDKYDRNVKLLDLYKSGKNILNGEGQVLGKEVIQDVAQNLAIYFSQIEKTILKK
jgi:hypothetical protein